MLCDIFPTISVTNDLILPTLTDPCTDNGHPCFSKDVSCDKLSDTEFECGACPRGLRGNARGPEGCQPVDECLETSPCFPGASCENLLEGYQCGACPNGYTGEGIRGYDIHDTFVLQQVRTNMLHDIASGCHGHLCIP